MSSKVGKICQYLLELWDFEFANSSFPSDNFNIYYCIATKFHI